MGIPIKIFLSTLVFFLSTLAGINTGNSVAFPSKDEVTPENAPFLATLWTTQKQAWHELDWNAGSYCGAVMLSNRFVLTAAHCVVDEYGRTREDIVVMAGLKGVSPILGEALNVTSWLVHPRFSRKTGANDIAIGMLKYASRFGTESIMPIASKFEKNRTWLYGWGTNQQKLRPVTGQRILQNDYTKFGSDLFEDFNPRTMIAAGYQIKKENLFGGACFGDSGGPLLVMGKTGPRLLGIVSNGAEECDARVPTIYTRMSYYQNFVKSSIETLKAKYAQQGWVDADLGTISISWEDIFALKVLPEIPEGNTGPFYWSSVMLQTTENTTLAQSDIYRVTFGVRGKKGDPDHKWILLVLLRGGKTACAMREETMTRIDVGNGLPAYASYAITIPRERGKCFVVEPEPVFISSKDDLANFSVTPGDKAMFEQGRCDYPRYRPMMWPEILGKDANKSVIGGWLIELDPRCKTESSFGPFFRIYHSEYRSQTKDLEPGQGMWIGPFNRDAP